MIIPNSELSTAELAAQTSMKLTNIHRAYVSPLLGMVYFCRLDGKLMRVTEARRLIESRIADNQRREAHPVR